MGREWRVFTKLSAASEFDYTDKFLKPWIENIQKKSKSIYGSPVEQRTDLYVLLLNHKDPTKIDYGLKFRDLSFKVDGVTKKNVIKSDILELKVRKFVTKDGVETWEKVIRKSLAPSVILFKEMTTSDNPQTNSKMTTKIFQNVPITMKMQDNSKDQEAKNGQILEVESATDTENKEEEKIDSQSAKSDNEDIKFLNFNGKSFEICYDEIVRVLKKEFYGQKKSDISEAFYKSIDELDKNETLGFVITNKSRYQTITMEDTFIQCTSFKYKEKRVCDEEKCFLRSYNIEDSQEPASVLAKNLPSEFEKDKMVCGYPELLWMVMDKLPLLGSV